MTRKADSCTRCWMFVLTQRAWMIIAYFGIWVKGELILAYMATSIKKALTASKWTFLALKRITIVRILTVVKDTCIVHNTSSCNELGWVDNIVIKTFQASHIGFTSSTVIRTFQASKVLCLCVKLWTIKGALLCLCRSSVDRNCSRIGKGADFAFLSVDIVNLVICSIITRRRVIMIVRIGVMIWSHVLTQWIFPSTDTIGKLVNSSVRILVDSFIVFIYRTFWHTYSLVYHIARIASCTNLVTTAQTVLWTFLESSVCPFIVILMIRWTFEIK